VPAFFAAIDFELVDGSLPDGWVSTLSNGVMEIGVPTLLRQGFWEDFFDGSEQARTELQRVRVEFFGIDEAN